jgi:predicted DNA-binding transcriptional regulator YafY
VRRADRLYRLTDYLRARRLTTAQWLSARLEVSVRTVYRDIADLIRAGVPIEGAPGVGYSLSRRMDLPPLMLDRAEVEALALGLRFTQALGDEPTAAAAERAQAKLRALVPGVLAERMRSLPAYVTRRAARSAARFAELPALIEDRRVLRLNYRDESGQDTEREVWPLGAICSSHAWSLVAWCELRNAFRAFRLDRIGSVVETPRRYEERPGRRLHDYFARLEAEHGVPARDFDPEQ